MAMSPWSLRDEWSGPQSLMQKQTVKRSTLITDKLTAFPALRGLHVIRNFLRFTEMPNLRTVIQGCIEAL